MFFNWWETSNETFAAIFEHSFVKLLGVIMNENHFNLTRKISIYFVYFNFFPAVSPIIDWATGGLVNTKLEKSISKSTFGVQIWLLDSRRMTLVNFCNGKLQLQSILIAN